MQRLMDVDVTGEKWVDEKIEEIDGLKERSQG